ncbi:hypothetical protein D6810_01760 [Candidatus Dojkabacteria bacterium]|uniref:DUF304 domain-containing protein n=1 Tax=Candidatus Dojkabacteria bacterium TaxID=2099670 RepID=A0A3M0Z2I4_9BACT|nr:MAG: hypothetical protein D6810_01760 [Candidatus Dojkabacteria bacterium]
MDEQRKNKLKYLLSHRKYFQIANQNKEKYYFSGQNFGEIVFALFRRSPVRNFPWLSISFFLIVLPVFFPKFINFFSLLDIFSIEMNLSRYVFFYITYYALFLSWLVVKFADWYLDVFILTNERLIEMTFKPFGEIMVREIWLEDIEVVKTTSAGFLGVLFNYGNINIVTRSANGSTELKYIGYYNERKNMISDLSKLSKMSRINKN